MGQPKPPVQTRSIANATLEGWMDTGLPEPIPWPSNTQVRLSELGWRGELVRTEEDGGRWNRVGEVRREGHGPTSPGRGIVPESGT